MTKPSLRILYSHGEQCLTNGFLERFVCTRIGPTQVCLDPGKRCFNSETFSTYFSNISFLCFYWKYPLCLTIYE
jgi:hypothetical protein